MSDKMMDQVKTVYGGLNLTKKISIFLTLAITISCLVFIMTWAGSPNYKVLYSGMNSEDAGSVLAYLQENNIPFKITAIGNSISIPEEIVDETRIKLAANGLPQGGGVGFEIFDDTKIGMTEFSQNINYQRALQGELSRTINRFDEIENSRVHIVMASKTIFEETQQPATASVVIKLYPGRKMSANKVQSIIHLLSSAIPGLKPENVTVVDNNGNMLTDTNQGQPFEKSSDDQLAYQSKIEMSLENRVKTMIETALGQAKAAVRISCLMDYQKLEKTEEMYFPENRVIRSEQHFNETSSSNEPIPVGIPGVIKNDGTKDEVEPLEAGAKGYQKNDQTVNYEIGKVVSHIIEPIGKMKRLSIAVIVDGTYREVTDESGNKSFEYIQRTTDEMVKLKNIVKTAVNFDEKRGDILEIVNMPFETAKTDFAAEESTKTGWFSKLGINAVYIKYGFAVMIILLTFMFVVRPIVAWLTTATFSNREMISELPKTINEIEGKMYSGQKQISFQNQANDIFSKDGSSVELLKQWLTQS
ncbi:MAG: flagellar M-ring protein FliF [Proteobacteria bacterium]|nr:flagellar M-ring protein FliF [Pseudomonadota bacterium]MBU4471498.1 flagellar M-ring protein FliF [Pseudomonadota bacterium]MCG2752504.1 flagellar M-ring protein FliF [Desulfobacteraceae bacterium]